MLPWFRLVFPICFCLIELLKIGKLLFIVLCCCTLIVDTYFCIVYFVAAGYTVITGPTFKVEGDSVSLTCNSTYGTPVEWFLNKTLLDDSWTTANGVTTNIYTFLADKTHHLAMFECIVDNVLSATWYFQVYSVYITNFLAFTWPQLIKFLQKVHILKMVVKV